MGTMRERSPGSWELTVSAGVDPSTGRYARVIRTVQAATKRAAKAALRELEVEVASGHVGSDDPTVAELLERWMTHLEDLGRSPATLYNYRRYIDRELVPDDRRAPAVEADGWPPRRALLGAAPPRIGAGDDPPDARHRPGGIAPGRAMGSGVTKCCVVGVATLAAAARAAPAHRGGGGRAHRGRRRARADVRLVRARRGGDRDAPLRGVRAALERRRSGGRPPGRPTQPPVAAGRGRRSADQDPLGPNRHARSATRWQR